MTRCTYLLCLLFVGWLPLANAVVGGQAENDLDWPFLGSIRSLTGDSVLARHHCGGTYIGDGFFLTAAHCAHRSAEQTKVCLGHSDSAVRNNCYQVTEILVYPNYDSWNTYKLDIALFKLSGVKENYPYAPLPSTAQNQQFTADVPLHILGLGVTSYADTRYENPAFYLQGVTMPLIGIDSCQRRIGDTMSINEQQFLCAGSYTRGSAMGDSGTGAFVWLDDKPVLAGLVSHGYNGTGIYTRIAPFVDWIREQKAQTLSELVVTERLSWPQDNEGELVGALRLTNLSERTVYLEDLWLADEQTFQASSVECEEIAAGESCYLELRANLDDAMDAMSLIQVQYAGVTYQTELHAFALTERNGLLLAGSSEWLNDDQALASAADGLAKEMFLVRSAEQAGSFVLSGWLNGFSGEDSLQVKVGEQLFTQLSGRCRFDNLSIPVKAGEHLALHYLAEHLGESPEAGYLQVDSLSLYSNAQAPEDASLRCDYMDEFVYSDSSAEESSSGGSSGCVLIVGLLAIFGCRRANARRAK